MGVALGWLTLALAAVTAAPEDGRGGAPIKYTVRFVDADGLGWRDAVYTRLTPVTRQGSATVWTAPAVVAKRLQAHAMKAASAHVLQAPTVIARPGSPAHITTRAHRQLVTQVAWNGDDRPVEAKPETVRTGSAATLSGRKLDQGMLVRMVLQDTQIIAVHRVALGGPKGSHSDPAMKRATFETEGTNAPGCCRATMVNEVEQLRNRALDEAWDRAWGLGKSATRTPDDSSSPCRKDGCCEAAKTPEKTTTVKWSLELSLGGYQGITLPEGRYMVDDVRYFPMIPNCTGSSAPTKAESAPTPKISDEVVAASAPASACCANPAACGSCPIGGAADAAVAVEVPEIGSQEIAGEWLIPKDGLLLVSFGPHTVADKDGKAVIRERLAIIEAEESAEPAVLPRPSGSAAWRHVPNPDPWSEPRLTVPTLPGPAANVPPPVMADPGPMPMPVPAAGASGAMPPMPSRSFPQGYHGDGKAAELPPLPADQADDDDDEDSSGSAEPRPSPQMRKPRQPGRAREARPRATEPTNDSAMKKAQFSLPNFPAIPTLFQPAPAVGLQFLVPIKPVSFKLPFNRRLEIEVYGRVVRNPEPARSTADLATKPAPCETTTK